MCKQLKYCMENATPEEMVIFEELQMNEEFYQDSEDIEVQTPIKDIYGREIKLRAVSCI